ncbi:two-component sensor histidine kinase, partial [Acinetobacter baumannii]|nr:two-component sensor histidine kinase [Acinetobacter baumannii]
SLGGYVGRRIVIPMRELADAVTQGASPLPHASRADELGVLARALDAHTSQLRAFLDRERFFTGDVSHELRTPLTVIMGAAEILMEDA